MELKGNVSRHGSWIIALPEEYTRFDPSQVLREFTEQFKKRYDVECVSALHHNKTKKNYHIHLIFPERRLLPEPEVKIATRSVFYDETGKRVRTKKEITGEDGMIREGCTVIKKGDAYEKHLFTAKDEVFKNELFLDEAKQFYTTLINRHIHDPERRLKVFDPNSVYLPTGSGRTTRRQRKSRRTMPHGRTGTERRIWRWCLESPKPDHRDQE